MNELEQLKAENEKLKEQLKEQLAKALNIYELAYEKNKNLYGCLNEMVKVLGGLDSKTQALKSLEGKDE